MQSRPLGRTGLSVSVLGFGCGAVGGLMVRGGEAEQERAVARAVDLGITYFDTAPSYGDGASETNLGRVLGRLRPDVVVGTKFHVSAGTDASIQAAITASLETSLRRLGREQVDLLQLHNPIAASGLGTIRPGVVIDQVLPALQRLRVQGKFRFAGFTAVGDTALLRRVIASAGVSVAQVPFNLLNPSAGRAIPDGYPGQDYGDVLAAAQAAGVGVIGIRVLAGGALSAAATRHPLAAAKVDPIGSGRDYRIDAERASAFGALADAAGAVSIPELAIRFAISNAAVSTTLVGLSSLEQLEAAAAAALRGPLTETVLHRIHAVQDGFVGQPR